VALQRKIRRLEGQLVVLEEQNEKLPRELSRILAELELKRKRDESGIESKRRSLRLEDGRRRKPDEQLDARQKLRRKLSVLLLKPRRPSVLNAVGFDERKGPRKRALRMERGSMKIEPVEKNQTGADHTWIGLLKTKRRVAEDEKNVAPCGNPRLQRLAVTGQRLSLTAILIHEMAVRLVILSLKQLARDRSAESLVA
jgi:hypothetical protein